MGEEDRVENQDQEGYRSLWGMLQCPVRISALFLFTRLRIQLVLDVNTLHRGYKNQSLMLYRGIITTFSD
jgi:hypothetical protein